MALKYLLRGQQSDFRDDDQAKNLLHQRSNSGDGMVRFLLTLYFIFFVANMSVSVPENHMSTGVHQTVGDCNEYATDLAGHNRQVYLCQENFNEDFNFQCSTFKDFKAKPVYYGSSWYTICSNPHTDKLGYILIETFLALMGIFTYVWAFSDNEKSLKMD